MVEILDIKQEVIIKINKNKPDLVFQCRKCGHELFIDKIKFFKNQFVKKLDIF